MKDLEDKRRQQGGPEVYICELHGEHTTIVCISCYSIQQERVERESLPLRMANTTEAKRAQVIAALAESNGSSHGPVTNAASPGYTSGQ